MRWIAKLFAPIARRKPLGNRGEVVAARHLKGKGYKVLMRNFVTRTGEVDIVARQGDLLVFVEVKTRESAAYHQPHRQVTAGKQRRVKSAARAYMSHYDHTPPHRFDVVSIVWPEDGEPAIEHIVNAF